MQTSSLNISLLNFEYKRTFKCECGKTIRDFELIFSENLVHRIRIGDSFPNFVYGSEIFIYLGKSGKKAILDPFLTKGAISRKKATINQNSQRYPQIMGLIYNCFRKKALYFKRGKKNQTAMKKQKLFCTLRWENFLSEKDGNCV